MVGVCFCFVENAAAAKRVTEAIDKTSGGSGVFEFVFGGIGFDLRLYGGNVFVLFQPECDHCQEEAIQIEQRLQEFRNYTLYFISSAPMEQIDGFARNFGLHEKENVKFAWTSTQGVLDHYGPIPTPSVYVYADGRLRQSFKGQTPVDTILKSL